ncbi:MAG TPA: carboxypeptidase regulatory-like domain-containing protein [Terriglobales bacterium]|nr:carboxypeptidase regulatory-like domain-containing protein [Terriglobales bacterium]
MKLAVISKMGFRNAALVLLSIAILAASMLGQTASTGALTGTVKDASGAVIPNATVIATNNGTNQARTVTTGPDGTYKLGFMPPGSYRLKFEAAGFSTAEVSLITINVTETPVLDQTLTVGGQSQQVEVQGETETVQTTSSTVGTVVAGRTLTDIPLSARNYTTMLGLAPGANTGVYNAANLGRGSQDISVNGSSFAQNNYQQDGAPVNSFSGRGTVTDSAGAAGLGIVNPDAIQEFKIQTSGYDAGYGRQPGASVNVVTKSGTNDFHGSAFEFFRNTSLNANEYFRKQSPAPNNTRQRLDQHQFGGTFGGPVKKDKLFFFTSFQETRQKNGNSAAGLANPVLVGIPQGDRSNTAAFRTALGAAFCPTGSAIAPGTTGRTSVGGTQVACNGSNINPVAINILQLKNPDGSYFIPSSTNGNNQNVNYSIPAIYKEHQAVGNFDYLLSQNNTLTGRWFYSENNTLAPFGASATSTTITQSLPGSGGILRNSSQYAVTKLTSILSNTVVNEARVSFQRGVTEPQNTVPFTNSQVGIRSLVPTMDIMDTFAITGLMTWGGRTALGNNHYSASWQLADQISWSHGKHTTRAGFEFDRRRDNTHVYTAPIGSLTFQTFQDFLMGLPGCAPTVLTAACTASGAAGTTNGTFTSNISSSGTSTSLTAPIGIVHYNRAIGVSAFMQDDYKVSSHLTLNLGMRWEYNGLPYDTIGHLTNIWPSLISTVPNPGTTGSLAGFVVPANFNFATEPTPPVPGVFQNNKNINTQNSPSIKNFAPRAGFAWKPFNSDKFVVRGAGGYFYDRMSFIYVTRSGQQGQPYAVTVGRSGTANYFASLATPYDPSITLGWTPRTASINTTTQTGSSSNLNQTALTPDYPTPTTYQWNLNIQYEFLPKWLLEIGYVGSRSIHQIPVTNNTERQINAALLASPTAPVNGITTNTTANASVRVPYLGFGPAGLGVSLADGDGKFNSLQVTVRKQFSHGLQMQAAYTFSRSFDTAIFNNYNDPLVSNYGQNAAYRPQRLAINYSYDLPFGHMTGVLGKIAEGWSLSGVTVIQNGDPLTIVDTRGGTIYGFGGASSVQSTAQYAPGMTRHDVATSGDIHDRLGATINTLYFNKAAFGTVPVIGNGTGYGNSGLGTVLGPGQLNFDATLQKVTKVGGIHEGANLVFRTEFFNLFNHTQFADPTGGQLDLSNATFGKITATSVNPRLVQFALKYVF